MTGLASILYSKDGGAFKFTRSWHRLSEWVEHTENILQFRK